MHFILFGNYFLAFCIVALSFETSVKNDFVIANPFYYLGVFFAVVVYYTHAYINEGKVTATSNIRAQWYLYNRRLIIITQIIYTFFIAGLCFYFGLSYYSSLSIFNVTDWLLLILFPVAGLFYYGAVFRASFRLQLRNIAWLKPFIIGFVCTGMIVIYPMLFFSLQQHIAFHLSVTNIFYFLTNWLFTTVIAIMFDIKDFAADHNYHLKTFVVTKGLRNTIFFILLPMATASFFSFFLFARLRQLSALQIFINAIPFFLLLLTASSLRRRKGILYYLVVIDGLLLLKAAFGIGAMLLSDL